MKQYCFILKIFYKVSRQASHYIFTITKKLEDGFSRVRKPEGLNQSQEKTLPYIEKQPGQTLKELLKLKI
jgi:hypothetical protein